MYLEAKKRGTEAQSNEKSHTHLSYKHKHRQEIFEIICRTETILMMGSNHT